MPSPIADIILDSLAEGVVTIDGGGRITAFNRAAETLTGLRRDRILGQPCQTVFGPCCGGVCIIADTLATGRSLRDQPGLLKHLDGVVKPVAVTTNLLTDARGRTLGAVGTIRDVSREQTLEKELKRSWRLEDLISRHPRLHKIFDLVPTIAASTSPALIRGEEGTGRELLARAIHHRSPRSAGPFITVAGGALPDALAEDDWFGHAAGPESNTDQPGRFARAHGGTLFLEAVDTLSPALQVRLLRVLEDRRIEPRGTAPVPIDVRIIASATRDLTELVEAGTFRRDLAYRLTVVQVVLPPLRERAEDIPLLAEHFVDRLNRLQGRKVPGLTDAALAALSHHRFPGNVSELEHVVERAFVLCQDQPIDLVHLPETFLVPKVTPPTTTGSPLAQAEAEVLSSLLRKHRGNRQAIAEELGIHRATLYRKMREHGLGTTRPA